MRVYAVFEPPVRRADPDVDGLRYAESFRFVRDGFSWAAFIFTPLWMLRYRLWLALVLYLAIFAALGWGELQDRVPHGAEAVLALLLGMLIGFEGATIRRRKLLRWGWHDLGIVAGENLQAAEQRFFDRWVAAQSAPSSAPSPSPRDRATSSAAAPAASEASAQPPRAYDPASYVVGQFSGPGDKP